jgi:hypothetical protein
MYNAYVTTIKNVRLHPNADRLDLVDCFGNTVCVSHGSFADGDLCIYFPTDGQLSEEFCREHDLVRRKDDSGNPCGGYLEPDKRNIKAIRLRGEKSDGLVMPLSCLEYTGIDIRTLEAGFCFTVINGHPICQKYIPRSNRRGQSCNAGNLTEGQASGQEHGLKQAICPVGVGTQALQCGSGDRPIHVRCLLFAWAPRKAS